jgi:hypothetical protein
MLVVATTVIPPSGASLPVVVEDARERGVVEANESVRVVSAAVCPVGEACAHAATINRTNAAMPYR